MRVIGGKDYYDSAMSFGQEGGAIFKRAHYRMDPYAGIDPHPDPEFYPDILLEGGPNVDFNRLDEPAGHYDVNHLFVHYHVGPWIRKTTVRPVIVWFCGKRYAGLRVQKDDSERVYGDHGQVFWSAEPLLKYLNADNIQKTPPKPTKRGKTNRDALSKYFEPRQSTRIQDFLIENRISIAVWDQHLATKTWIVNGDVLKCVQFQKVLPPFQAMQELSMYVDGILPANANPIVEITDDKVKIAKHGFDEWTFRRKSETPSK